MKDGSGPVTVSISRGTIEEGAVSKVADLLERFAADGPEERRNRVRLQVSGYDDDGRELFEIDEVRAFFRQLFEEQEGLFYWLDPGSDALLFLGLMLYDPVREGETASLHPDDLERYLTEGIAGMRNFCRELGLSPVPAERAVTDYVKRKVGN